MIVADPLPLFPPCPAFGFTSDPVILTTHIRVASGREQSTRHWDQALREFTPVPIGERLEADIQAILTFWLAIGGTAGRFRFTDWTDYRSVAVGETPAATDQPLAALSSGEYQLVKQYSAGSLVQQRTISRPIGDTIAIANEVGTVQDEATWTLDEATGLVTPESSFDGTPTTWGGDFQVKARFLSSLPIEVTSRRIQSTTFAVIEVRE
jgi:uncharacterized protein (TIGR02217 family)